jgi:hypothetical protein
VPELAARRVILERVLPMSEERGHGAMARQSNCRLDVYRGDETDGHSDRSSSGQSSASSFISSL